VGAAALPPAIITENCDRPLARSLAVTFAEYVISIVVADATFLETTVGLAAHVAVALSTPLKPQVDGPVTVYPVLHVG